MSKVYHSLLFIILSICAIFLLGLLIWSSNKGLDLSDESIYLIGYSHPDEIKYFVSYFPKIINRFFGFIDLNIQNLRLLRLFLTCFSSFVLGWCLYKWIQQNLSLKINGLFKWNLTLLVLIGALASYSWVPQTLSYNSLSLIVLMIVSGLLILLTTRLNGIQVLIIFGIMGILSGTLLLIKFPNFFLLLPFIGIGVLLSSFRKQEFSWKCVLSSSLSFMGGIVIYFVLQFGNSEEPRRLIGYVFETLASSNASSYESQSLWDTYYKDFGDLIYYSLTANLKVVLLIAALLVSQTLFVSSRILKNLMAITVVGLLATFFWRRGYYLGGVEYSDQILRPLLIMSLICGIAIVLIHLSRKRHRLAELLRLNKNHFVIALLIAMPFVGALGTNNGLSKQLVLYLAFLIPLFYLFLLKFREHFTNIGVLLYSTLLIALTSAQIFMGIVNFPYLLKGQLTYHRHPVDSIKSENILMNEEHARLVNTLANSIRNKTDFQAGDPIFTFRHELGLVYLLDGKMPVYTWLKSKDQVAACSVLSRTEKSRNELNKTIVLLPSTVRIDTSFSKCLTEIGINYPEGYQLIDAIPYLRNGQETTLQVFAPIQ